MISAAAGDVFTYFDDEQDAYAILKVLRVELGVIHVRTYQETFDKAPDTVDMAKLEWDIAHMPYSNDSFAELEPQKIGSEKVSEEDLEGYNAWKQEGGVAF